MVGWSPAALQSAALRLGSVAAACPCAHRGCFLSPGLQKSVARRHKGASADGAALLFGLAAPHSLLLDVHQVTVHAGPPREGRHDPVRAPIFAFLVSEGFAVEQLAVLQGNFAVPIGTHFVGQLGHGKQCMKHLVHVGVLLCRDLKVRAVFVSADQLLDLVLLYLPIKVPVALVAADDQRDVHVLLGFVSQAGFGLVDLPLQALHLLKGVPVVQAEHQDEHITCTDTRREIFSAKY